VRNCRRFASVIAAGALSAVMCTAQQAPPASTEAPKADPHTQAAQPYAPLYQEQSDAAAEAKPVPDSRPLSGILGLTLGSMGEARNTLTPSFRFGQVFDSNPGISGQQSNYTGESSFGGSLNLHRAAARQSLDIAYSGGAVVYDDSSYYASFHSINLAEMFSMGRWTLTLTDGLNYSPQGSLGAGLGLSNGSVGSIGMSLSLTPNQGIYTPLTRQLANAVGGQVQYGLSPRSSWTVGVTYGTVIYPDADFQNTHQINARTGYNYNWTAKDSFSIFYEYGAYGGGLGSAGTNSHSIQLAYARRVTGRLTWSISAGPQIAQLVGSNDSNVAVTVATSLQYQRARTSLSFGYNRGVSQAVIGGSTTNSLQAGVNRTVTRHWSVGANGGFSRNTQLAGTTEVRSGVAGVYAQRSLWERSSVYFNYAFQRQISDGACAATFCTGLSRQVFGFGFNWTPRSWILR
jgi:hypothetical protein